MKTEFPIILASLAGLLVLWSFWRGDLRQSWLTSPGLFLFVWLGLFLLPYLLFGPSSYLWMDDEGDLLVPFHLYLATHEPEGIYSYVIGAGADLIGSFLVGGEFLSPERGLMAVFPLWIAIAIHKTITCLSGFLGTYYMARRMARADRFLALGLAAIATVYWYRMVLVTFGTGMTLATVPLCRLSAGWQASPPLVAGWRRSIRHLRCPVDYSL